jgi:NitT/TauT family transport system substrate-binding protein
MEFTAAAAGPAIVTSLASGQADIGGAIAPQTVRTARAGAIDLRLLGPYTITPSEQSKVDLGVYTREGTGIKTPADLEGKRVGVVTLKAASQLTIEQGMLEAGADPSTVKWVQIPLPESAAALQANRIDATFFAEPFTSFAKGEIDDLVQVPLPLTDIVRTAPATGWATSDETLAEKSELIAKFQAAVTEATELIIDDPTLARQTAREFTEVPPAVLKVQNLPEWTLQIDDETLDQGSRDGARLGYQKAYIPLDEWTASTTDEE